MLRPRIQPLRPRPTPARASARADDGEAQTFPEENSDNAEEKERDTTCEIRFIPAPNLRRVLCAGLFGCKAEAAAAGLRARVRVEEREG